MKPTETILHSANVLVCTLGVVTASGAMVGAAPFVGGAMSIAALMGGARPKTSALDKRVGAMLTKSLNNPNVHLPQEAAKIIPQMIEAGALSHGEVMGAARDPVRICAALLAKLKDPEHRRADMQQAFERVVVPIFAELLNDRDVCDTLRPAYERALAGAIAHIQKIVEQLKEQSDQTARRLGIQEGLLIGVARRYAANNPDDFDSALAGVEQALEVAARERAQDRLSDNLPDAINDVIARVDELNDAGRIDEGKAALLAAMADQRDLAAQAQAGHLRLIAKGLTQAVLTRDLDMAVMLELERLALDAAGFDALRAAQGEWYERGHDKGLRFDLEVAIALAEICTERAGDADQRGAAATDLGTALHTLGERESGTVRLEAAVTVYTRALEEYTQDRVPWGWAGTQNNLGNALWNLGKRESGTARLEEAVAAYARALEEWAQDRVPLYWAMTQNNLGNALQDLGDREGGTVRLEDAVTAYTRALEERTQDRVPLDWATTQNNLGNTLKILGERENSTARLEEAVTACVCALEERTQDRVPLDWAMTQNNLGNALWALGQRESGTARLEEAVTAFRRALEERTQDRVPLDWAATQSNLGNSLRTLGQRESNTARLEAAMIAFTRALEEMAQDRVPLYWAATQYNLAFVEVAFAQKTDGPEQERHARAALAYVEAALQVFDPESSPFYFDKASTLRKDLLDALQQS